MAAPAPPQLDILHLSVLNGLEHPRVYHKMARSQAQAGYRVGIAAQGLQQPRAPVKVGGGQVSFHPIGQFGRLSAQRWWVAAAFKNLINELRPRALQLHTPELLPLGAWAKRQHGCAVVYDLHEDYRANLRWGGYTPWPVGSLVGRWLRGQEERATEWLDHILLAEYCFTGLLPHPEKQSLARNMFVLAQQPEWALESFNLPVMVVTGTLAEAWGIRRVWALWRKIYTQQRTMLYLVGFAPKRRTLRWLQQQRKQLPSEQQQKVSIIGGERPVEYGRVQWYIRQASYGVALYEPRRNLLDRVPTKFYEHMALRTPLVFTSNPKWNALNARYRFGLEAGEDLNALARQIVQQQERGWPVAELERISAEAYSWPQEAKGMLAVYEQLLGRPSFR